MDKRAEGAEEKTNSKGQGGGLGGKAAHKFPMAKSSSNNYQGGSSVGGAERLCKRR